MCVMFVLDSVGVHMCMQIHVHLDANTHKRPEVNIGIFLSHSAPLVFETGSLTEPEVHPCV